MSKESGFFATATIGAGLSYTVSWERVILHNDGSGRGGYISRRLLIAMPKQPECKLAWDLVGSEFAGRHQLYEKFYAGNSIVVRNQSDREAPWKDFHATVERLLDRVKPPTF
jgi:hypothetical protein